MMKTSYRALPFLFLLTVVAWASAQAQFLSFEEEETETKWGATVYYGGDVDSLGNHQFGLRVNYSVFELDPLGRFSPEATIEFRKNYGLFKIGARGDTRELFNISAFGGAGVFHIRDITNSGTVEGVATSDETWYAYAGGKLRLPDMSGVPLIGRFLAELPLENVSLFAAEEFTGLSAPEGTSEGLHEHSVNEWYEYSLQFGFMVGTASGWQGSGGE